MLCDVYMYIHSNINAMLVCLLPILMMVAWVTCKTQTVSGVVLVANYQGISRNQLSERAKLSYPPLNLMSMYCTPSSYIPIVGMQV